MAKILMTVELEYDADVMYGTDDVSIAWFFDEILSGDKGQLLLHSNEIGDTIGTIRVLSIAPSKRQA